MTPSEPKDNLTLSFTPKPLQSEEKSTKQETDSESLQDRIQKLLSTDLLSTLKPDKFASTNIVNPVGDIRRKLNKGFFDPNCKLVLGGDEVPGTSYYHSFFNIEGVELKEKQIHLYGNGVSSYDPDDRSASYIVHSHEKNEYCPWKGGCHVALILYPTGWEKLPKWFKNMWFDFYESFVVR